MSFRFLHTADWHLGKPFGAVPGDAGAELRAERLRAVERVGGLATERGLDAILVAGDIFDTNEVEERTLHRLVDALASYSGYWILLPGNHDAALPHSAWTRLRQNGLADTVIIADQPRPLSLWADRAVVLPAPLIRRREPFDQTGWFDDCATAPGAIRVGLAHGSLPGFVPPEAQIGNPVASDRADRARLDYLALGDWHGQLQVGPRSWYSGTPETDRFRDNQSGRALVVEIEAPGEPPRIESVPITGFRWTSVEIEANQGIAESVEAALAGLAPPAQRNLVSLTLSGSVSLADRATLEHKLTGWRSRLHHLELDLTGLREEPTEDDLDAIDTSGFVRLAVDRLRVMASGADPARAEEARTALRMLYLDHMAGL